MINVAHNDIYGLPHLLHMPYAHCNKSNANLPTLGGPR